MSTQEVGDIILHVEHLVMHTVVPGEELITKGHVDLVIAIIRLLDIDVWELRRVGTTDIVLLRIGGNELVAEVVGEAAVHIERPRVHEVLHRIESVGKGHRILAHTSARHTGTTVHRRSIRVVPDVVLRIVVTNGNVVVAGDVPVQANQELGVLLISRIIGVRTGVITILALHEIRNGLHVSLSSTRNVVGGIHLAIGRSTPTVYYGWLFDLLEVGKEEQPVLDDRAAQGEAIGCLTVLVASTTELLSTHGIALHVLVLVIDVGRALEGVRTRLGDGIDTTAHEVSLTNVIRRNDYLELLDGID